MTNRLPAALLAIPIALLAALPQAASAKPKYKECEFTKKLAKKHKAPRCAKKLSKSSWIVVSGQWQQVLTVTDQNDDASFDGTATADFRAGGLSGANPFPTKKNPTVSMVSTWPGGVDFSATSEGGWTTPDRFYDCGWTAPAGSEPNGFGGIFTLRGRNVRIQWPLGGAGFACDSPYGIPSPRFPDPVQDYPLKSFKNRRLVVLPIAFDFTDTDGAMNARNTYDGVARLRRYR